MSIFISISSKPELVARCSNSVFMGPNWERENEKKRTAENSLFLSNGPFECTENRLDQDFCSREKNSYLFFMFEKM